MFPYFGRKARNAGLYPAPRYPNVMEPFAGSLAYSLHFRPQTVEARDLDERLVALWQRGVEMGATGVFPMPPEVGTKTDDLLVKLASYSEHASTSGTMTVTSRMIRDWPSLTRNMAEAGRWAAGRVFYQQGDYRDLPNLEATWFIDPPYQFANRRGYRHGASGIDFDALAEWCQSRRGQVIVCEQEGADWLPFKPLYSLSSHRGSKSTEVIWTNTPTGLAEVES